MRLKSTFFKMLFLLTGIFISAQNSILLVSSATGAKKILRLNSSDGSVINANFIDMTAQNPGTVKGIAQVNDRIWVTDQTGDKIYIYDLSGAYVSTISSGLDNLRGINVVNNEVWVTNAGSANGATANSIVRFSMTGTLLGTYPAPNTSIFDVLDNNNGTVYVSGLDTNGIQKINYSGVSQGNLVPSGVFQNLQQINFTSNGNIIAAVFQNNSTSGNNAGVYVISSANGSILNYYPVSSGNLRGVIQADNGNILYTTGSALFSINTATGVQTQLVTGQFQYLTKATLPNLSVNDVQKDFAKIFPNPATDFIMIQSDNPLQQIHIFASDGRLVRKQAVNNETKYRLNISDLSTGNYYLQIESQSKMMRHQFIKK